MLRFLFRFLKLRKLLTRKKIALFLVGFGFLGVLPHRDLILIPLQKSFGFEVTQVMIRGNDRTSAAEILEVLNASVLGNVITNFNPLRAIALLERLPWVDAAHVQIEFPNTLVIQIQEYPFLALYQHNARLTVINSRGEPLNDVPLDLESDLLVLSGDQAHTQLNNLYTFLTASPWLKEKVLSATWIGQRRWNLHLDNGILIKLPQHPDQIQIALDHMFHLNQSYQLLQISGSVIDMRIPKKMVLNTGVPRPQTPPTRPEPSTEFFVNIPQNPPDTLVGGNIRKDTARFSR